MPDRPWRLERFAEQYDRWAAERVVPARVERIAHEWIASRVADPTSGARRVEDEQFEGMLWFAVLLGTLNEDGEWLTCSFLVRFHDWTAVCTGFECLPGPFIEYPELA